MNILLVDDTKPATKLSRLPHYALQFVNTKTAELARVLLRFEEIERHDNVAMSQVVSVQLIKAWLDDLLISINNWHGDRGEFIFHEVGLTPPWQPYGQPEGNTAAMRAGLIRHRWAKNPHEMPNAEGYTPPFGSQTESFDPKDYASRQLAGRLFNVAQSVAYDVERSQSSLTVISQDHEGKNYLTLTGALPGGVTISAHPILEESYKAYKENVAKGGCIHGEFYIDGAHYVFSTSHQWGFYFELKNLLAFDAIDEAFDVLWKQYFNTLGLCAPVIKLVQL
jgi:hypothetical protein